MTENKETWDQLGTYLSSKIVEGDLAVDVLREGSSEIVSPISAVNWASRDAQKTEKILGQLKENKALTAAWKKIEQSSDSLNEQSKKARFQDFLKKRTIALLSQEPRQAENEIHAAIIHAHLTGQRAAIAHILERL